MRQRLKKLNYGLIGLYLVWGVPTCLLVFNHLRYRGVGDWPSVPAEIIGHGGLAVRIPSGPNRAGVGGPSSAIDTTWKEYRYTVNGIDYTSRRSTPDGSHFPIISVGGDFSFRAYYKPGTPSIAVLQPIPYRADGLALWVGFSSILVAGHLTFRRLH